MVARVLPITLKTFSVAVHLSWGTGLLSLKYLLFSRVARDAGSPALSSGGLHCESTHKSQVCEIVYFNLFDTFLAFRFRMKYL